MWLCAHLLPDTGPCWRGTGCASPVGTTCPAEREDIGRLSMFIMVTGRESYRNEIDIKKERKRERERERERERVCVCV